MSVRLEWDGKPTQVERISLPFQTVETINESRGTSQRAQAATIQVPAAALARGAKRSSNSRVSVVPPDNA